MGTASASQHDAPAVGPLLRAMATRRALVVGDVMLDSYSAGVVERASPEAPAPVVRVQHEWEDPGGAANVARQVVALGGVAQLVGPIGQDAAAGRLRAALARRGVGDDGLVLTRGAVTTHKHRVLVEDRQVLREDRETPLAPGALDTAAILDRAEAGGGADVLLLSDYAKGALPEAFAADLVRWGCRRGMPVLVDPKRRPLELFRGATVVQVNRVEFERLLGAPLGPEPAVSAAEQGGALREAAGVGALVVTLGEHGMVVADGAGAQVLPGVITEPRDVSGAGDTVLAVLGLALAAGADLRSAAELANRAASAVVGRVGVSSVDAGLLLQGLPAAPVVVRSQLDGVVGRWADEGRRVVFTNGCFDLLHAGHRSLLSAAAQLGDALVVAVDDDRSVAALKGAGRPVVPFEGRCADVAAVPGVQLVVGFGGDDLEDLVSRIRPDVLVKGADYDADAVVGGDLVRSWGGTVHLVPLVPGVSTTALVERGLPADA